MAANDIGTVVSISDDDALELKEMNEYDFRFDGGEVETEQLTDGLINELEVPSVNDGAVTR